VDALGVSARGSTGLLKSAGLPGCTPIAGRAALCRLGLPDIALG